MPGATLQGKIALVTGAANGIGMAVAERFAQEGARVVLADIAGDEARTAAARIGSAAHSVRCDVSDSGEVEAAVAAAVDTFGGLDILVNNAARERAGALAELDERSWRRSLDVNLGGAFHGIRHAAPAMRARGGGAIVNVSSIAAQRAVPGLGAYAAAKAGVEALTRCAAVELRPAGIRVNAIAPGLIRTTGALRSEEALEQAFGTAIDTYLVQRQGRWGLPEEVACVALHLASEESSFTSGLIYVVDNANSAS
ncbi:SDR family NAD(P)-dependent oxidoreductase [Qaidamihabitans albus]|uniref:SDR family NAD(P)-dependent oxidoreductase n=1 Tax=Qaidamihabitans albus TaxID=2795733 RepID=UPI0018F1485B|nr:SDR family oxidoreductase [Qaidamihabitans albus]